MLCSCAEAKKAARSKITLDAKMVKRAIERERHNMPTLDKLKAKLNGATFISKKDFKNRFQRGLSSDKNR
jgi:hypothetical protein